MSSKKIITVFGATGQQGGSVAQIFLNDPKLKNDWTVRGVSRNANGESAKKLISQGAEVVTGDSNDKASLEKAMSGATAVFAVTNYWEKMDGELETQQGKNMADAAKTTTNRCMHHTTKAAGVKHFIWSSLINVTKASKGRLTKVQHFDSKARVEEYIREIGLPATFFMPGIFMSGIAGGTLRRPSSPGAPWTLALPTTDAVRLPVFTPADAGKWVKAIVLAGVRELGAGRQVYAATGYMSPQDLLAGFARAFPEAGRDAVFATVPDGVFVEGLVRGGAGLPAFAAEDLLQNMQLMESPGYYAGASLDESHALLQDELTTWEEFAKSAPAFKGLK
ncbi:uncharacterized protein E0L32_004500 [Thyridium curvatum]|uniref:NmrA-like domain-containing protein n=1 Tax=Thyridium curvatum TaxID=1093900 RepID=A0A507BG44_9PEZI|nr:uncharacterized protein E0L32_004500 [Thyridium curvatum]TPX15520.1 hypothetical protein E0L32_004500 [Thyridium curvatum]